jgi:hypothetical protein
MNAEPNPGAALQRQASRESDQAQCTVSGLVNTLHRRESSRSVFEACDVTDPKTGQDIKNLPCAGMNLEQGDLLEITVRLVKRKAAWHSKE